MNKRQRCYKSRGQAGFTLLEILIALMIAAIMVTIPILAFKDNQAGKLKNRAYQLIGLLQIAQEESIFRGVELGLRLERNNYYFMLYDGNKWQPLQEHKLLKKVQLEEPIELYVNIDGQEQLLGNNDAEQNQSSRQQDTSQSQSDDNIEQAKKLITPQIYMLSSGEMNPFTLTIGLQRDDAVFYRVKGDFLGALRLSQLLQGHYRHDWDVDLEEQENLQARVE